MLPASVRAYTAPGDGVLIQQPVYYPFAQVIEDNEMCIRDSMGSIPLGQVLYLDHMLRIPPSRVPSGGSRTVYNAYIVPDGARGFVNSL